MKKLAWIVCLICSNLVLYAQKELPFDVQESRIDSAINDLFLEEEPDLLGLLNEAKSYQFLYWRANYDSKTFYAGREIGFNQYNLSSQLFYLHSVGFYVGLAGAWYSDLDPGFRTSVLSFGYGKGLKNKLKFLRYRASFDLFTYHNNDPDFEPTYTSSLNLGTSLKSKLVSTRFDAAFLLGKEVGTHLNWDIYTKITLLKFGKFNKLQLEPELSFFLGSETVEYDLSTYLYDQFDEPTYYYENVFGLLNTQIALPVSLSVGSFDFELSWQKNSPRTMGYDYEYDNSSFLSFSVGYIFNL